MKASYRHLLLFLVVLIFFIDDARMVSLVDPTYGFVDVMLNESNFEYQKPYDTPLCQRYIYQNGTHRFWVYSDDKPHHLGSNTQPRTEIRILVISLPSFPLPLFFFRFNTFFYYVS